MANTVVRSEYKAVTISAMDSDWTWTDTFTEDGRAKGIPLWCVEFTPGAVNDVLVMQDTDANGSHIFPSNELADAKPQIKYYGGQVHRPFIDFSESTLSAGHQIIITLAANPSSRG